MQTKSSFKNLGTSPEAVVSVPATVRSLFLSNTSSAEERANVSVRRATESFALFSGALRPGETVSVFRDKGLGVTIEGADSLVASATGPVDVSCSYDELAGSQPLFDTDSWNDRESWAAGRGASAAPFNPPQFVLDGLNEGASRWRTSCCYQKAVYDAVGPLLPGWKGLELENYTEINADNGYLAACGVNLYVTDGSLVNAVSFDLQVNLFYGTILTAQEWGDIMTHEMGHGLGVGIFWTASSFFLSGTTYPSVQSAYNSISELTRDKTPLESSGGGGTASAHWEDDFRLSGGLPYYGVSDELMVGALVPGGMVLSDLSVGALKDFGYETYPSVEGRPRLNTANALKSQERILRCGLSSRDPEKMMRMLRPTAVASDGKFTLRRYILA